MARMLSAALIGPVVGGRCTRTNVYFPSASAWMSKTSPGFAPGTTIRFFASAIEIAIVGSSHPDQVVSRFLTPIGSARSTPPWPNRLVCRPASPCAVRFPGGGETNGVPLDTFTWKEMTNAVEVSKLVS